MEGLQVHAQWDGDDVGGADAVEFFARKPGGTDHGVILGGRARVGEIGEAARGARRKHLARKAIQAFMRDHHRSGTMFTAPSAERPQREPVRDLQGIGSQCREERSYGCRHHRAVATGERNQSGGHGDPYDTRGQQAAVGVRTRDDEKHFVAGGAVLGAEPVHRGAQAAGARAVEIGDLNNTHKVRTSGACGRSTI